MTRLPRRGHCVDRTQRKHLITERYAERSAGAGSRLLARAQMKLRTLGDERVRRRREEGAGDGDEEQRRNGGDPGGGRERQSDARHGQRGALGDGHAVPLAGGCGGGGSGGGTGVKVAMRTVISLVDDIFPTRI